MTSFERLSSLQIGVSGFAERVGGTPMKENDWTDMAQALGKCKREEADLLRAIYLHDTKAMRCVVERLARTTAHIEHAGLLSRDLAYTTLRAFAAMRPCEHCEGIGRIRIPPSMLLDIESGEWLPQKPGGVTAHGVGLTAITHISQPKCVRSWEFLNRCGICYLHSRSWTAMNCCASGTRMDRIRLLGVDRLQSLAAARATITRSTFHSTIDSGRIEAETLCSSIGG